MTPTDDFIYSAVNLNDPIPAINRKEAIYGWVVTFLIVSWICVCMRFWVRFRIQRAPGWDDLFVGLYLFTMTIGCVLICVETEYFGFGQHLLLLPQTKIVGYLKTFYVQNATYSLSTAFIKIALLLQFLRVYERGTMMYRVTLGFLIFTATWGFVFGFMAFFPCFPVYEYWNLLGDGKHCYGYGSHVMKTFVGTYISHSAINMVLDLLVLMIPLPLVFENGSSTAARVRVAGMLLMGSIVIALATWRLQTMIESQVATYPTRDPTWYGPISIVLAALEINAASICASVPIFWPVLAQNWGGIFVTQEIKITSQALYNGGGGGDDDDDDDDDDCLTHHNEGKPASGRSASASASSVRSRSGSELSVGFHTVEIRAPPPPSDKKRSSKNVIALRKLDLVRLAEEGTGEGYDSGPRSPRSPRSPRMPISPISPISPRPATSNSWYPSDIPEDDFESVVITAEKEPQKKWVRFMP